EDVMSRVSYVMMNPDGREKLTTVLREALNELIGTVCEQAGITREDILDCVFVGNPIMHHLFLGIDPTELGGAPFALAVSGAVHTWASELKLDVNEGARVYVLPCIAGHVGADAAAATLCEAPQGADEMTLLVDVGTNAEIVLGHKGRTLACSSPTGPAFEGAEICCGQRAAPGAIERVRIDPVTMEPRIRVIGADMWSDEEGFDEAIKD
ncbi:MAG: ASKHA domain-containing protein, partial [Pseudomonadota bacterium]